MTAKELRDTMVDCRKVYFLLEARNSLFMAGEKEISESVQKAIKSLGVTSEYFFMWRSIFHQYNLTNKTSLSMSCTPCWNKVLTWAIKVKKVDE